MQTGQQGCHCIVHFPCVSRQGHNSDPCVWTLHNKNGFAVRHPAFFHPHSHRSPFGVQSGRSPYWKLSAVCPAQKNNSSTPKTASWKEKASSHILSQCAAEINALRIIFSLARGDRIRFICGRNPNLRSLPFYFSFICVRRAFFWLYNESPTSIINIANVCSRRTAPEKWLLIPQPQQSSLWDER